MGSPKGVNFHLSLLELLFPGLDGPLGGFRFWLVAWLLGGLFRGLFGGLFDGGCMFFMNLPSTNPSLVTFLFFTHSYAFSMISSNVLGHSMVNWNPKSVFRFCMKMPTSFSRMVHFHLLALFHHHCKKEAKGSPWIYFILYSSITKMSCSMLYEKWLAIFFVFIECFDSKR